MADTSLRDVLKIGDFVGQWSWIIKVTGVNNGGTITRSGDWVALPDEENYKAKRVWSNREVKNKTGGISTITTRLVGYDYESMLNQRDDDAYEMDATYAGSECLLLVLGHYFANLGTPEQQWLAIFGTVQPHDADQSSEDGKVAFKFRGMPNTQAIEIVKTADAAAGKITAPVFTGFTQNASTITIPAYTGKVGIYKYLNIP